MRTILQCWQIAGVCLPCLYIRDVLLLKCKWRNAEMNPYGVRDDLRSVWGECLLVAHRFEFLYNFRVVR